MLLEDAAAAFAARAEGCRERAILADEGASSRDAFHARSQAARSWRLREAARAWDARAREARRGGLLLRSTETNDPEFMREFTDLVIACEAAGRCRYVGRMLG